MKRDPIVLGKDYILPGSDVGKTRPNANVMIVGATGVGKSFSVVLPTLARSNYSNPILSYAKAQEAYAMANYLTFKDYKVHILDISNPEKSTISFDPLLNVESYEDIQALADIIIDSCIRNTKDDYWQLKAKPLLAAVVCAVIMLSSKDHEPTALDMLNFFDHLVPYECGNTLSTEQHDAIALLEKAAPDSLAVREFRNWLNLPLRTCQCVRDTLAAGLSTFFTQSIRQMMNDKPPLDLITFTKNKEAILVVTSALETTQAYYANLFYRDTERRLLKLASTLPGGELPREVRYIFDDFACTAAIEGFPNDISLFRAAGVSAIILLQSEQQLEAIYKEASATIRMNCGVYAFYPGGFDDRSCEIVSRRTCLPYEDILYAPMGKVFIMRSGSGSKPVHIPRYDILNSQEYQDYLAVNKRAGEGR